LQKIEPPSSNGVANAFKSVASAREERQKLIEEAAGERNRRLPKSRADAESLMRDAEAYAREVVEKAQGDSERFLAVWHEYNKAKDITAYRLYLEAVENIMPRVEKLIVNPEAEKPAETSGQYPVEPEPTQEGDLIHWHTLSKLHNNMGDR
jgi:membrane protease subunit HflK